MAQEKVSSTIQAWAQRKSVAVSAGVPSSYVDKLAQEDVQKAAQGRTPMSNVQAAATLRSLSTNQGAVNKSQGHGILDIPGNALGDIKEIATGFFPAVGHMITSAPHQAVDLSLILGGRQDVAEKYGINQKHGWGDALRNISKLPLVQYTPGLHTAANLTSPEGRQNIMENPLITGLDLLPAAKLASKAGMAARGITTEAAVQAATREAGQVAARAYPKGLLNKTIEDLSPEVGANQATVLNHSVKAAITNGAEMPVEVAGGVFKHVGTDGTYYYTTRTGTPIGPVNSLVNITGDATRPIIENMWKDVKHGPAGATKTLLDAVGKDGIDVASLGNEGLTTAGEATLAKYFDVPKPARNAAGEAIGIAFEKPPTELTVAKPGSATEALAAGQPVKALSRFEVKGKSFSKDVLKPVAKTLGVDEGMRAIYKAAAGTIPRKMMPATKEMFEGVGKALSDMADQVPEEMRAEFFKNATDAAIYDKVLPEALRTPEMLAAVQIIRDQAEYIANQGIDSGKVVEVQLIGGGTELFDKGSPVATAYEKMLAHEQRKPNVVTEEGSFKGQDLGSQERVRKWTEAKRKLQNEYKDALAKYAPLRFQGILEKYALGRVGQRLLGDEELIARQEGIAPTVKRVKQGHVVSAKNVGNLPDSAIRYLVEQSEAGNIKMHAKTYRYMTEELGMRAHGKPSPVEALDQATEQLLIQKMKDADYGGMATEKEIQGIIDNTVSWWQKLKKQGMDPVAVPYLGKGVDLAKDTFIAPVPEGMGLSDISRFRNAVMDFKPRPGDVSISLSREAFELMRYDATRDFHNIYVAPHVVNPDAALNHYARLPGNEGLTPFELKQKVLEDYVPYDPTSDHPFQVEWHGGAKDTGAELLPKNVATHVKKIVQRDALPVKGIFNKANRTFRVAVLTSPRHISHIAGGGLTQMLLRDPMSIFKIVEGFKMVRNGEMPIDLPRGIDSWRGAEMWAVSSGKTMSRVYLDGVRSGYFKFRNFEEFLANTLKATDYLFNKDRAMKQGLDQQVAHEIGIKSASKALASFDDMSPFERQYIRSVVPFYGFTRHLTRYLLSYPGDHPYKAALLSQIVTRENEDWNSSFGKKWNNLFFIGSPDAKGNISTIDLKSLNPFRSAYNNFTVAGILSQTHPLIQNALQFAGYNPVGQTGELYPDLSYDPQTGNLVTRRKNVVPKILQAWVPQLGTVDHYIQWSDNMKRLSKSNPEAYRRQLFSSIGIPFEPGHVNVVDETARTQKNVIREAEKALSNAMSGTGTTKRVRKFSLVPFQGQLLPGDKVADYIDSLQELIDKNPQLADIGVVPKMLVGRNG